MLVNFFLQRESGKKYYAERIIKNNTQISSFDRKNVKANCDIDSLPEVRFTLTI